MIARSRQGQRCSGFLYAVHAQQARVLPHRTLAARARRISASWAACDHKDELAAACREEVFKRQQDAADDWRTDKELAAACKARRASRGPSLPPRPRSCGLVASRRTLSQACCTRQDWAVPCEGLHRLCHPAACEVVLSGPIVRVTRLLGAARHKAGSRRVCRGVCREPSRLGRRGAAPARAQSDVDINCKDAAPVGGKVQECLAAKRALLSWDCQEQLFRQEVEDADDMRLSARLFRACLTDKKQARARGLG